MNKHSSAFEKEDEGVHSEDEYSEDDRYAAMAVVAMTAIRRARRRDPQPMHNSRLTGSMRVEEILNGHHEICQALIMLQVICSLKDEFIRPPDYTAGQPLIEEHSYKYRSWFDGRIGAIDGTHVPCVALRENADAWINRKGHHSQNVLVACSFDMRFTYMLTGYEGSCHDARMLDEAIAFYGFPIPPPGEHN
ncbi:hypothetical protein TIFTF001_050487 [Ficus carica]|uniref:DDE Tnp4 domain-containing protein n=1 Tax=Ficus carica TaxID=3494 RepID=A0AA87Z1N0_FICCA|nr:hypothetical protein TIFTF001_050481 [Ficus carica]GMN27728.1 hypothetical protein TIFTF001_050483 [Ficus carica]GMN27738.1 hypothetical protein TIFTF001_050485 [Ficus carica]GMN27753.1 hypothetical protein TIFTF001_050487 [Ficus carica]